MKKITVWTSSTCGACKMLKAELAQLEGKLDISFIATDDSASNLKLAKETGVKSLPTIIVGDKRLEGFVSAEELEEFANE